MGNNVKHFLEVKKGKETVYVTQIFGDGFVPDEKFYKGLGLDIDMDLSLIHISEPTRPY